MKFISTRGKSEPVSFSQAIINGLAPDGGLYVPEEFPEVDYQSITSSHQVLEPFLKGDPLETSLPEIVDQALNFEVPLIKINKNLKILELFHGPTASFKDFGARFLAQCYSKLSDKDESFRKTILVATSGDTGGAVASAFYKKANFSVEIYFPVEGVSPLQKHQLTCWDSNITSYAVESDFDSCQKLVKTKLAEQPEKYSTSNSINVGRLLPQMTYYAMVSVKHPGISFIVPSGNMGNVVAAFWARKMGFPIDKINIATNSNKTIGEYFRSGEFSPRPTVQTLANAMDVGSPSNLERLMHLFPDWGELKKVSCVKSVDDEEIKRVIKAYKKEYNYIPCPHTATALSFFAELEGKDWVVAATAHPAKFIGVLEPLVGEIDVPSSLAKLLGKPSNYSIISAD